MLTYCIYKNSGGCIDNLNSHEEVISELKKHGLTLNDCCYITKTVEVDARELQEIQAIFDSTENCR